MTSASNPKSDDQEKKNSLHATDAQNSLLNQQSTSSNDHVQHVPPALPVTQVNQEAGRQPIVMTGIPTPLGGIAGFGFENGQFARVFKGPHNH